MGSVNALVDYVEAQAGKMLRVITQYDSDGYEVVYLRDDLDKDGALQRIETIHQNLMAQRTREQDSMREVLGKTYASVQIRGQAIIIRLVTGEKKGVLISLNPEASRDLNKFIAGCFYQLRGRRLPN